MPRVKQEASAPAVIPFTKRGWDRNQPVTKREMVVADEKPTYDG